MCKFFQLTQRRLDGRRKKKDGHKIEEPMTHENWKHVPYERQECVCVSAIVVTTTLGALLTILFFLTEQVF